MAALRISASSSLVLVLVVLLFLFLLFLFMFFLTSYFMYMDVAKTNLEQEDFGLDMLTLNCSNLSTCLFIGGLNP